ncbi:hypothetical protein GF371_01010 [Candidatus Woesearchaeota archaeon]|nr:hypothetical protein [Candidatus Woesearchaeota archaeon]
MTAPKRALINAKAAGLAVGILWAVALFITTIVSMYKGYGSAFLNAVSTVYPGYTITWGGAFVGLIYGFLDGFIGIVIVVWLYNYFAKKL